MQPCSANILICKDAESAAIEVANRFICVVLGSVAQRGVCYVAIPGGTSPRKVFELLADKSNTGHLPWDQIHIFFTDERIVPPDSEESNYKLANDLLLSKLPIKTANIHRFMAEIPMDNAAQEYESKLHNIMGDDPKFDLIILGMGEDTHIASLFPQSEALNEQYHLAAVNYVDALSAHRLTLTFPAINNARNVIILAFGDSKADGLHVVLQGELDTQAHPVQAISPVNGELIWIVDQAAAARL